MFSMNSTNVSLSAYFQKHLQISSLYTKSDPNAKFQISSSNSVQFMQISTKTDSKSESFTKTVILIPKL